MSSLGSQRNGRVVRNTLDTNGDLSIVQSQKAAGTMHTYANAFTYTAAGAVSSMKLGNGKFESTQFNSRLQPVEIGLGNSATDTSLLKLDYSYGTTDNNGNVKSQTINTGTTSFAQTYLYDSLNRLTEAKELDSNNQQTWKQNFGYDRYGNRTTFAEYTGAILTNEQTPQIGASNNRFTTASGFVYDLSGNVITDNLGRAFNYNGENKQREVRDSQQNIIGQYFYDGDGKRVKKVTDTETTIFVYDAGGKLVAEYSNATPPATRQVSYTTTDHLGSPRVITNALGQVISRRDFMPFGEEIARSNYGSDNVRQKFTGYERDNETSLDYAKARMFGYLLGRFTSPDPLSTSAKPGIPQSLNRYVYVLNNPLTLTDPTGMVWGYYDKDGKRHFHWFKGKAGKFGGHTYSTYTGPSIVDNTNAGRVRLLDGGAYTVLKPLATPTTPISSSSRSSIPAVSPSRGGYVNRALINSLADESEKKATTAAIAGGVAVAIGTGAGVAMAATGTAIGGTVTTLGIGADYVATHPEETDEIINAISQEVIFGAGKTADKWASQTASRGWTVDGIREAVTRGESSPAVNNLNPSNGATRFVHPTTGQSVVIDNVTKEVIHIGGPGFKY